MSNRYIFLYRRYFIAIYKIELYTKKFNNSDELLNSMLGVECNDKTTRNYR